MGLDTVPFLAAEGTRVLPGDVLYSYTLSEDTNTTAEGNHAEHEVQCGSGCVVRRVVRRSRALEQDQQQTQEGGAAENSGSSSSSVISTSRRIVARQEGLVHWVSGTLVTVVPHNSHTNNTAAVKTIPTSSSSSSDAAAPSPQATTVEPFGPCVGDTVLVRISRVTKNMANGSIIAVRGKWASASKGGQASSTSSSFQQMGFRGVLRAEDIRPFRPTKDKLVPDPVDVSMRPGDVVAAVVLSQSDSKQYQLSTVGPQFGVVESTVEVAVESNVDPQFVVGPKRVVSLLPIPHQRDGLLNPLTGEVLPRWGPLVHQ